MAVRFASGFKKRDGKGESWLQFRCENLVFSFFLSLFLFLFFCFFFPRLILMIAFGSVVYSFDREVIVKFL